MNHNPHILWTAHPLIIDPKDPRPNAIERCWENSVYPIGNGRLGGAPFGEPRREHLQFNVDSMWVGNEHNTGAFQPFGDVFVDLPHDTYRAYRRELDIDRAVQCVTYQSGGATFCREYFASRPAQLIVMRFTADKPGQFSGFMRIGNIHNIPITAEPDTLVMRGDNSGFWYWQWQCEDAQRLLAGRTFASDKLVTLDFEARVRLLHDGGSSNIEGNTIRFDRCNSLTILLAADTNFIGDRSLGWRCEHPHDKLCARIDAGINRSFDDLLAEHVADYQQFFHRVGLSLGDSDQAIDQLPTAERLALYTDQAAAGHLVGRSPDSAEPIDRRAIRYSSQPNDRNLEVLLYQYARYLLISSSAPGERTLPANLQGIWCIAKRPPWRCDFHTDVNVQMNYWFSQAANLADCFIPLAQWVDSIREVRKEETRQVFGVQRGWLMRSENGPFGGSTWFVQKGDSAWLCQNLWDQFAFTQDRDYLKQYAWPVMKEISEFWLDHLKELPDGTLVAPDGRSPEHGPKCVDGVTYDQSLCWDLFNNTIEAAEVLGIEEDFRKTLIDRRDRLLGPQIGRWGQLQEWMEDIDNPEDDHRHVNHMIGVYPGRQIHQSINAAIAEAAHVGVSARRDHGPQHPGWSRVWKACLFARLFDAESAYRELVNVMAQNVYGNLWAVHPPFQIDANFGFAAAVNEILVQSHLQTDDRRYVIHLLPALPAAWARGSVQGLRVRGGLTLDMTWHNGQLKGATLRNLLDAPVHFRVRYSQQTRDMSLGGGEAKPVSFS